MDQMAVAVSHNLTTASFLAIIEITMEAIIAIQQV